jgi:hypothetical protein
MVPNETPRDLAECARQPRDGSFDHHRAAGRMPGGAHRQVYRDHTRQHADLRHDPAPRTRRLAAQPQMQDHQRTRDEAGFLGEGRERRPLYGARVPAADRGIHREQREQDRERILEAARPRRDELRIPVGGK